MMGNAGRRNGGEKRARRRETDVPEDKDPAASRYGRGRSHAYMIVVMMMHRGSSCGW